MLIRIVDGVSSPEMIRLMIFDSYMSPACADIAASERAVEQFVAKLG